MDIQTLVQNRWKLCVETPFAAPLRVAEASATQATPYAIGDFVTKDIPLSAGRCLQEHTVKITVYHPSERTIQQIFAACGLNSTVPMGFHKSELGDKTVKAVSRITDTGAPKVEPDPPLGGGKCFSRVLVLMIRTGSK